MPETNTSYKSRLYWGRQTPNLPNLDLLKIHKTSFQKFLDSGIQEVLNEINPIEDVTGKNYRLEFGKVTLGKPSISPDEAIEKGLTYDAPLKVQAKLTNKQTEETVSQEVFLCDIPLMLERGTFIVNGVERAIVHQLVRAPGAYYSAEMDPGSGKILYTAEIRPLRGSWLEFSLSRTDTVNVKIDRRRKFPVTTFLRAIGLTTNEEILEAFSFLSDDERAFISNTLAKDTTSSSDEAVLEIYRRMRPGDPLVIDTARGMIDGMFFNDRRYNLAEVGRYKIERKLKDVKPLVKVASEDVNPLILNKKDVLAAIGYLIGLSFNKGRVDDIDHLGNRRVRSVGELTQQNAFRVGILRLERVIRERMTTANPEIPPTPTTLVNARPVMSAINEFFRTSQLATILDQTNPLAEVDTMRRLSVMGTGGITRERAAFSIRDINSSQYSRVCPVRSPEGPNIGLVTYLALYARINELGFIEAPYRRVVVEGNKARVTDEIVYITADDEDEAIVTHSEIELDKNNCIVEKRVPIRHMGEFTTALSTDVDYIDIIPRQIIGTSASLIPFLSHDDANRALMGTHMQCQAVPLLIPHSPIIGTGMEYPVSTTMGRVVTAEKDGVVEFSDANKVVVRYKGEKELHTYPIRKFVRSQQSTCYSQRPFVLSGQQIKAGDVLVDGPASEGGELALGQNLSIAYMSFDGLGYEDAIVISDRLVKSDLLTSVHIEEHTAVVVDTKLGPEETTRDIPNVSEEDLANLDEDGVIVIGAEVGPNDILVGKIAPKGETELTAEERLLRAIFGEKAREVRDTSLRVPHGERGTVIGIKVLSRENGDELEPGAIKKITVKIAQMRKVVVGDKLCGRHGNKGVISKIVPEADMPHTAEGKPVDIIISPLSVLARMNLGQLMEAHLGISAQKLGYKVALPVFEEVNEDVIIEQFGKAGLPANGKTTLYDGRTGEAFDREIVVGTSYILKLIHMVEDKTHARSTGPYSLITQQPLGGKAQMGGQRLGEMEVWALEAYGAAHILQEMLTIKSDDIVGRPKAFEAIVKGTEIPTPQIPESFKVLVKELQSLCLNVEALGATVVEEKEVKPHEEKAAVVDKKAVIDADVAEDEIISEIVPDIKAVEAQTEITDDENTEDAEAEAELSQLEEDSSGDDKEGEKK